MKPVTGSFFVIWGDVQGAFHSLVRVLEELRSQDIIDEDFHIIRPHTYFVFNGDLINRGAYTLEVLTIVLKLMQKNPDKIFYIRGNHEDRGHWKNFNLKRDLVIRASYVSDEEIPLGGQIDRFFYTLPLALYLIAQETEDTIDLVRISHYGRGYIDLDEEQFSGFFEGPNVDEIQTFKLANKLPPIDTDINIKAIVKGESRSTIYRPTIGLTQLEADKGATAFTLLSSPTESYRHLQDFYFDAFGILRVGKTLSDWTLTLYNQDVRELIRFKRAVMYNLATGLREFVLEPERAKRDAFAELQKKLKELKEEAQQLKDECPEITK